jgi:protein O-mannosyl-transferase
LIWKVPAGALREADWKGVMDVNSSSAELTASWNQRLRDHPLMTAAVLTLATFAAYGPALANGFAFDDEQVIVQNPYVADPGWWRHILATPAWAFVGVKTWSTYYRPLQIFSYWLFWRLDGPNPGVYHLFQLIFYVASVWFLYRIGCELIGREVVAFAGALLWALHPVHVEAVAWAAALPDVGVGFFCFLAFLLFLRAEREGRWLDGRHVVAALAFGLGLLFKENALSLLPLMVAYWFFLGKPGGWPARLVRLAPYVVALGVYLAVRIAVLGHFSAGPHIWSISESVVGSALALLGAHLRLFIWPVGLSPVRSFNWIDGLHSVWPWAALLLLVAGWALRKREPLFAFFTFAWLIALLPCLDIRQITTPFAADRYSFLPTFGLCLALGWLVMERLPNLRPRGFSIQGAAALVAVVAALWTVGTEAAIPHWRSSGALMRYGLRENPDSGTPYIYKAIDLEYRVGDLEGAAREFRTAMKVNQSSRPLLVAVVCQANLGLGEIAYFQGRSEEALKYFSEVLRLCPDGHEKFAVYDAIGAMSFVKGQYAEAAENFRKAVQWGPADVSGHYYLGTCEIKLGHFREAAEQFHIVTQIDPSLRPAYMAEAAALDASGDTAAAARIRAGTPNP